MEAETLTLAVSLEFSFSWADSFPEIEAPRSLSALFFLPADSSPEIDAPGILSAPSPSCSPPEKAGLEQLLLVSDTVMVCRALQ